MNKNNIKNNIDEFIKQFYTIMSKYTNIFVGYPTDLLELDMNDFNSDTYFISDINCEKGKIIKIVDEELKFNLYKFCVEHEDRVFRGCKERKE